MQITHSVNQFSTVVKRRAVLTKSRLKMELLALFLLLVAGARSELILTVSPEVVEPDFTPFFSLHCSLVEFEEAKVVSLSISRQPTRRGIIDTTAPSELIAEIRGLTPNTPRAATGFETVTVLGQITTFESELGTYLEVVWPTPRVEDLGLYTCQATVVGEAGSLMPLTAQARVTTADPVTDRLLAALQNLENRLDMLNETIQDMQGQMSTDTEWQRRERGEGEEKWTEEEETVSETEREREPDKETTREEDRPRDSTEESLDRLVSAVESIGSKLDTFNTSLAKLEQKISDLEDEEDNETETDEDLVDTINTYFIYENSSYFLFQGNMNTDSYRAETVCESKRLYLAEINDEAEFQAISEEIAPYIRNDRLVLVAGRKRTGTRNWTFQGSGQQVTFFAWGPGEPMETRNSECMALRRQGQEMDMVALPCSSDQENFLFLCEDDD